MSRKEAREQVFGLVFEYCFLGERNDVSLQNVLEKQTDEKDKSYISDIYEGVIAKYDTLCKIIGGSAEGFSLSRIFKVDLAIMLVASYEILYYNVPAAVSINEAVTLAKKYSTQKSASFINGVLATLVKK